MSSWLRIVLFGMVLLGSAALGLGVPVRAASLDSMPASEIEALQRRLADAGCFTGHIDGQASDDLNKAIGACPTQDPQLRIETGMHVALIRRADVDASCTLAVTGSDDKTVRLWSLPDGNLLRTLRVPIAYGNPGKIFAVAISPDGRFVAAGGWDHLGAHGLYIFDASTGALLDRLGNYPDVINHLVFSPDGHWLAVTLHGGRGVRMLDTAHWIEASSDATYGDHSYGAAFGPDGSLYTVANDGKLRHYGPGPDFNKLQEVQTKGGRRPFSVAVDPSAQLVAVGFDDTTKIDIYDAQSLAFRHAGNTTGLNNGDLIAVSWSNDGRRLVAGGQYEALIDGSWKRTMLSFTRDGHRIGGPLPLSDDTIFEIKPCGSGFAVGTADPALGLIGGDGSKRLWRAGVEPDLRDKVGDAFTISADARTVRFGLQARAVQPVVFDLMAGTVTDSPKLPQGLEAARTEGLPVSNFINQTEPRFDGKPIELERYEASRSVAIEPDLSGFALGADWSLRSFDAQGKARWRQDAPDVTWGVDLSADGRILVAAYGDGTIRWHRWSDGKEVLALFVNRATRAWVAWTPSGYYKASPGGEDMIGWHLNRGWLQAADFFPASRFREKFNRPDVVERVLDTLDEDEALQQANAASKRHDDRRAIIERLPPVLTILSPAEGTVVTTDTVDIHYLTRTPSGVPVDRVDAFVDGAKVQARGLKRDDPASGSVTLPMPTHDATISLVAYAGGQAGDAVRIGLKRPAASETPAEPDALKPSLYALLVGVTHYQDTKYDLEFPAQDATGLAAALEAQKGKLYKDVEVKVLTDKDATTTAIKRGLSWLRKQTTSHDLAIVFAAGHGTTDAKGKFWFLSYDMDPDDISATAVSRDDITDVLFDLPGKKLLFLDACHSGAALNAGARGGTDVSAAISDFAQAEGGVVAYAASTGREFSFERPEWGHGAFTKALIEAFDGKADIMHKGTITTATLDLFLEDRVKQLTDGQQHPVMTRPKTVPDFPIALSP